MLIYAGGAMPPAKRSFRVRATLGAGLAVAGLALGCGADQSTDAQATSTSGTTGGLGGVGTPSASTGTGGANGSSSSSATSMSSSATSMSSSASSVSSSASSASSSGSGGGTAADPVIAAVGDVACGPNDFCSVCSGGGCACEDAATGALIDTMSPSPLWVLLLGDVQYENAEYDSFMGILDAAGTGNNSASCGNVPATWGYDKTWGTYGGRVKPVLGNHEYNGNVSNCGISSWDCYARNNYFKYFDPSGAKFTTPAGDFTHGYYAFDVNTSTTSWRVVVLNSGKCQARDSKFCCDQTSAQLQWLHGELTGSNSEASTGRKCTMAVFHHPYFTTSSSQMCNRHLNQLKPIWDELYANNVDVVLNGHAHDYERFHPQDPNGNPDATKGVVEFVVGSGGRDTISTNGSSSTCCVCGQSCDTNPSPDSCASLTNTSYTACRYISQPQKNNSFRAGKNGINGVCQGGASPCADEYFGVLQMTLHGASMDYAFVTAASASTTTVSDAGTITCH